MPCSVSILLSKITERKLIAKNIIIQIRKFFSSFNLFCDFVFIYLMTNQVKLISYIKIFLSIIKVISKKPKIAR